MSTTPDSQPHCLWRAQTELGEGPVWVPRERAVYFVDILGRRIHRWQEDGERRSWNTPAEPGFVVPCERGGFLCGLRGGLHRFDPSTTEFELLTEVERDQPLHRLNDGFVDGSGRLWFGTMHEDTCTPGGALYSLERGGTLRLHDSGYIVTNGPALSPDGRTLYHSDSGRRTVYAFTHAAGVLSERRAFVTFPDGCYPDGMAVDGSGHLWIAVFNGWRIERFAPDGRKEHEVAFPCARVTKLAFGGSDLRTLFVTTAWTGLTSDQRAAQPLAGAFFSLRSPVSGLQPTEISWDRTNVPAAAFPVHSRK
jgi:sugar lactone lactonase YvrE